MGNNRVLVNIIDDTNLVANLVASEVECVERGVVLERCRNRRRPLDANLVGVEG